MVRRRVAELWRLAGLGIEAALTDWAHLYQDLLVELGTLATARELSSDAVREQLVALIEAHRSCKPRSRAEIVRDRLIEGVRPVRALLKALVELPLAVDCGRFSPRNVPALNRKFPCGLEWLTFGRLFHSKLPPVPIRSYPHRFE